MALPIIGGVASVVARFASPIVSITRPFWRAIGSFANNRWVQRLSAVPVIGGAVGYIFGTAQRAGQEEGENVFWSLVAATVTGAVLATAGYITYKRLK